MPDGRRINRWFLLDQLGRSHLAVIGIERDTKDGHYTYTAVSISRLFYPGAPCQAHQVVETKRASDTW